MRFKRPWGSQQYFSIVTWHFMDDDNFLSATQVPDLRIERIHVLRVVLSAASEEANVGPE
jgi:hypothetical protein